MVPKSNPVKARIYRIRLVCVVVIFLFTTTTFAQTQGRVVINEYMPWPSTTCGTTSEFVELMNYGPGPVNIGCYILTTGVYSVTIPANTILQPGQYYVIAGQNFIPGTCANIDSLSPAGVHASLNWNTCNCTNKPIPTTGNGLMTDGGSGNTPLVLLDPSLNVIDAVVRSLPSEAVGPIVSSSVNGNCTSQRFDLSQMTVRYEQLGMATGKQNSFARLLDGDCNWQKTPQQSGGASNDRPGNTTDISYELDMVNPTTCGETGMGSVSIYVKHSNYDVVFPMSYTIAYDVNGDRIFDFADKYTTYTDDSPPFIEIDNLPEGTYRVTVASVNGCYLKSFDFTIIPCNPALLPVKLVSFKNAGIKNGQPNLEWVLQDVQNLQSIVLQKSADGVTFETCKIYVGEQQSGTKLYSLPVTGSSSFPYYRLKVQQKNGPAFYSPIVRFESGSVHGSASMWPNPATDKLYLDLPETSLQNLQYTICNTSGMVAAKGSLPGRQSGNQRLVSLPASLPPGIYNLQVSSIDGGQPISFRFVKH